MSKKSRFRGCFEKQYGKRAQALLKSLSQHLYHIHWSLARKLSSKMSLLWTCRIFRPLVTTLAAYKKYPVLNRENLTIQIQMYWSEKLKTFSHFFAAFLKSNLNFENFEKKRSPSQLLYFRNYGLQKYGSINVWKVPF